MTARIRALSRCPHCGARGVKLFEPLRHDGYDVDVPYCGHCGKNYPPERPDPPPSVTPFRAPQDAA
jgi:uncharacterized protein (DUF983 family)